MAVTNENNSNNVNEKYDAYKKNQRINRQLLSNKLVCYQL